MSIIPEEEFQQKPSLNLAPMVDFLFLVVAVFAVLAVTRTAISDFDINLAAVSHEQKEDTKAFGKEQQYIVNLSINEKGQYKWISDTREYVMDNLETIQKELIKQQELGILPNDKQNVKILLHIDKNAHWEPIAQAIFAVKEMGYHINPVYTQE